MSKLPVTLPAQPAIIKRESDQPKKTHSRKGATSMLKRKWFLVLIMT